jgi:hypothetical protein
VQKEVRYLGMEMGGGSHRPSSPELVMERRFGDCKDKALLLVALLRQLGIEAYPVLVDSDWNGKVDQHLPSPDAFDHAVTLIVMNNQSYVIDATASYQAGKHLADRHMGTYGRGLVVRKGDAQPGKFELGGHDRGGTEIEERFVVKDYRSPVMFSVVSLFRGYDTDSNRGLFANKSRELIVKDFREYYSHAYPGIKTVKPVEMQDDTGQNVLQIREYYEIENFFEPVAKDSNKVRAEIDTPYLYDQLPNLNAQDRKSPLALIYPKNLSIHTRIELPDEWDVTAEQKNVQTPWFHYNYSKKAEGKQTILRQHRLTTTAETVPAADLADYAAKRKALIVTRHVVNSPEPPTRRAIPPRKLPLTCNANAPPYCTCLINNDFL